MKVEKGSDVVSNFCTLIKLYLVLCATDERIASACVSLRACAVAIALRAACRTGIVSSCLHSCVASLMDL